MIISCAKCSTRYRLDDGAVNAIQKKKFSARCARCNHVFTINKTTVPDESALASRYITSIEGIEGAAEKRNCKVITICNQKGGVAKTTTCLNLGASLVLLGKRVLLIDFDIQASLSLLLGYKDAKSFFDVIHSDGDDLSKYILKTNQKIWLLPSNSKMALLSKKHLGNENFHYMLREKLESIKHYFDYVLIDTPPSGDFYTLNALLASDAATITAQTEYLSLNGVKHIENMINVIKEKTGHKIDIHILVTMYDPTKTTSKVILNKLNNQYNGSLYKTIIEKDEKIQESQIVLTPTLLYSKESRAGMQYYNLAHEIVGV